MADTLTTLLQSFAESETGAVRANLVYWLSEPTPEALSEFAAVWASVPAERKRVLFAHLVETGETNFELDFAAIAQIGLRDEDEAVRRHSVDMLWHNTEAAVLRQLTDVALHDETDEVRESALISLGRFVLAGELGEITDETAEAAKHTLRDVLANETASISLYRRALESYAYSSSDDVVGLIEDAFDHPDVHMRASAIHSMGRNADPRWSQIVLASLGHEEPEIRYEAAKASGEMTLTEAIPQLITMLDEQDQEILEATVWALGEIGGQAAQRALMQMLDEDWDPAFVEAIEDALEMATLNAGQFHGALLDIDDYGDLDLEDFGDEDTSD